MKTDCTCPFCRRHVPVVGIETLTRCPGCRQLLKTDGDKLVLAFDWLQGRKGRKSARGARRGK